MSAVKSVTRPVNRINGMDVEAKIDPAVTPAWGLPQSGKPDEPAATAAKRSEPVPTKQDPAIMALTLAETEGLEVYTDLAGNPCAKIPGDPAEKSWPVRSPRVKGYVTYLLYRETKERLSGRGLGWLLTVLEGKAWSEPARMGESVWEALDRDPVARVLVELVRARPFLGPMSCLRVELAALARQRKLLRRGETLPAMPELLGRKLDELVPLLAEAGIVFERLPRNAHYRPVRVYQTSDSPMEMSAIASALAEALVNLDERERAKEQGKGEQVPGDRGEEGTKGDAGEDHSSFSIPDSSFPPVSSASGELAKELKHNDAARALLDSDPELLDEAVPAEW